MKDDLFLEWLVSLYDGVKFVIQFIGTLLFNVAVILFIGSYWNPKLVFIAEYKYALMVIGICLLLSLLFLPSSLLFRKILERHLTK